MPGQVAACASCQARFQSPQAEGLLFGVGFAVLISAGRPL